VYLAPDRPPLPRAPPVRAAAALGTLAESTQLRARPGGARLAGPAPTRPRANGGEGSREAAQRGFTPGQQQEYWAYGGGCPPTGSLAGGGFNVAEQPLRWSMERQLRADPPVQAHSVHASSEGSARLSWGMRTCRQAGSAPGAPTPGTWF
jgi:hypothetical protein